MSSTDPVPRHFICPISLEIMEEPVICSDGSTYEKKEIERWLVTHDTSPKTTERLHSKVLIPNKAIKSGIQHYLAANDNARVKTMQVCVRGCNRSSYTVVVDKKSTVQQLKEQIEQLDGIDPKKQRLIYNGKQMDSWKLLEDYGVTTGSLVNLVLRLVGG